MYLFTFYGGTGLGHDPGQTQTYMLDLTQLQPGHCLRD